MSRYKYNDNSGYVQNTSVSESSAADDGLDIVVLHKRGFVSGLFGWIHCLVICVVLIVTLLVFFLRPVTVVGNAMEDTLKENDTIILTNFLYEPQQGDVVVINAGSTGENTAIIARVIAVGGQSISIEEDKNRVLVDGKIIDEPYVKGDTDFGIEWDVPATIPDGYVFVLGDNREASLDSRYKQVGLVHESDIIGKVQFLVYPFDRISVVE